MNVLRKLHSKWKIAESTNYDWEMFVPSTVKNCIWQSRQYLSLLEPFLEQFFNFILKLRGYICVFSESKNKEKDFHSFQ